MTTETATFLLRFPVSLSWGCLRLPSWRADGPPAPEPAPARAIGSPPKQLSSTIRGWLHGVPGCILRRSVDDLQDRCGPAGTPASLEPA